MRSMVEGYLASAEYPSTTLRVVPLPKQVWRGNSYIDGAKPPFSG